MESKDIILHSDEVNEIFAKTPSSLERSANTWLLLILLALLSFSHFVHYPDIISGNVTLTSLSAPINIISLSNGKIKLFEENNALVKTGDIIGYVGEDADRRAIDSLYDLIKSSDVDKLAVNPIPNFNLGKINSSWNQFVFEIEAYHNFKISNSDNLIIERLREQIQTNYQSQSKLQEKIKATESQFESCKSKLDKDIIRKKEGLIQELEFQKTYSQYEKIQKLLENLRNQFRSIDKSNTDIKKQIVDLEIFIKQNLSQKLINLKRLRISLIEEIDDALNIKTYYAPRNGRLKFNEYLADNEFISNNSELFTITPLDKNKIECKLFVPLNGIGKIAIGQQTIIRLDHFPEDEFGVLYGNVVKISSTPVNAETNQGQENFYTIDIQLNNGLMTSTKKELPNLYKLQGTADIITKDKSFLERIFEQLFKLIKL